LARHTIALVSVLCLVFLAVAPAQGGRGAPNACAGREYSYAGLQSETKAHGVAATIAALDTPAVVDGHVGAWIGVGGVDAGPGGAAEWLQVGLASFSPDPSVRMYYELTVPGRDTRYVELDADVTPAEKHELAVLEMSKRNAWWRVWIDGEPASPPIHLAGSHGAWYPQAVAENWNGGTGTCNGYAYRFSNVRLAHMNGGAWRPLRERSLFQDAGYRVVQTSRLPSSFVATSLG
jgi:hypothetical protein